MILTFVPPKGSGCDKTLEADYYPYSQVHNPGTAGKLLPEGIKVHCQISVGKQNNNIRYFANNVTVVDEMGRGGCGDGKPPGDGDTEEKERQHGQQQQQRS